MVDRLPQATSRQMIRVIERLGFILRRTTGSHFIYRHPVTLRMAVVPKHSRDIKRGLLFGILKQIEISQEDFLREL